MIYTIKNKYITAQINSFGSELWSLVDNRDGIEHLWQGNKEIWPRRAPNIFPVTSQLKSETALINGKKYHITLHGFLRDYDHEVIEHTDSLIRLRFKDNEKTHEVYPFDFNVDIVYELIDNTITQSFIVNNLDEKTMPFSTGYHTGYNCPFDDKHTIDDYELEFEKTESATQDINEDGIILDSVPMLIDKKMKLYNGMFKPNIGLRGLKSDWIRLREKDSDRAVKVSIKGFPCVVLWSAPEKIPYVCIEPWYGNFEAAYDYGELKNRPGIINLESKKTFSCSVTVTLEKNIKA